MIQETSEIEYFFVVDPEMFKKSQGPHWRWPEETRGTSHGQRRSARPLVDFDDRLRETNLELSAPGIDAPPLGSDELIGLRLCRSKGLNPALATRCNLLAHTAGLD